MLEGVRKQVAENVTVALAVIAVTIALTGIFWQRRRLWYLSWRLEGPVYKPIVGNIFDFGSSAQSLYETLHDFAVSYKNPVHAWFGPFLVLLVTDPDDIQIILNHENSMEKPFVYQFAKEWVGDGLITSKMDTWKSHRKLIAPTFNRKILDNYMEVFVRQSNVLVEQLAKFCGTNEFVDVFHFTSRCALDIICETAMGININSQQGSDAGDLYIEATQKAFKIMNQRVMKTWFAFEPLYKVSSLCRDFTECIQVFHKLTDKVVEEKRQSQQSTASVKRQKTFIDELFHQASVDNEKWTNKEVRDEISSMIAAGADTTSHSLGFTIVLLAMFPDVQEKVYREIRSIEETICGDDTRINIEACSRMTYTGQVIKESLRLFAPPTIMGRYTTGDVKLKTDDLVVPKDVFVVIGSSMLHRDEKIWGPEAHKFNPDNFSKDNVASRHPHSFIAFSGGKRNCVGLKFANLSMKVMLYKILRAYRLDTDEKFEDIKCEFHLLMKKVDGWKVKLHSR